MTNEQREAIDNLSEIVKLSKEELQKENENITAILDYKDLKSLDTALSLIKEQQEETDKYKALYERALSDLVKADKQIDLMVEYISKQDIEEDICMKNKTNPDWCNEDYTNCQDCIK